MSAEVLKLYLYFVNEYISHMLNSLFFFNVDSIILQLATRSDRLVKYDGANRMQIANKLNLSCTLLRCFVSFYILRMSPHDMA